MNDLPDMDELLRNSDRKDRSQHLWIGGVLIATGIAVLVGSRILFAGHVTFLATAPIVIGALFVGRAFVRSGR